MPQLSLGAEIALGILVPVFFFLGAFASFCERSFDSASLTKARYMSGTFAGRTAIKLLAKKEKTVVAARLISVLCSVGEAICMTFLGACCVPPLWAGVLMAVLVTLAAELLLSQGLASALGAKRPERNCCAVSLVFIVFYWLISPLTMGYTLGLKLAERIFKVKPKPELSERDLKAVVTDVYDEGAIEKDEHDLIQNSLTFDDKTIERIMTPKSKMVFADDSMSLEQITGLFIDNNYSRMPYISKEDGEVLGIIYQKDFYEMLLKGEKSIDEAYKPALFFSSNVSASLALKRLQRFRQHMALVRDSKTGKLVGLITVEDLIEELVGEIEDESDAEDIQKAREDSIRERTKKAEVDERQIASHFEDTVIIPRIDLSEDTSEDEDYKDNDKK